MKKELLDKYLAGLTTQEERIEVLRWVEASSENRAQYRRERKLYDASLVYEKPKQKRSKWARVYALTGFAALAMVLIVSIFVFTNSKNQPSLEYVAAAAQCQEQIQVSLSDGTTVLLNSGSSIEVVQSGYKERRVKLHGEAFFNVARNPEIPFIVETSEMQIKVLGTSFNVNAYDQKQSIVLVSGLVNVVDDDNSWIQYMSPNQKFYFDAQSGKRVIEPVQASDYTSWKDGFLQLRKESLSDILTYLQNYYDVPLRFDHSKTDTVYISGKLELRSGLKEALSYISRAASIRCSYTEDFSELKFE